MTNFWSNRLCGMLGLLILGCAAVSAGSDAVLEHNPCPTASPTQTEEMKKMIAWWKSMRNMKTKWTRGASRKTAEQIRTMTSFDEDQFVMAGKSPVCCIIPDDNCSTYCGIPPEISVSQALREIYLNQYVVRTLPATIGDLPALEKITIKSGNLPAIPAEIGKLTTLKSLVLRSNHISSLPAEIGNLKNLEVLDLFQNRLTMIPDTIGGLTSLKVLDMGYQRFRGERLIESIPPSIGQLRNLDYLSIWGAFRSVPEEMGDLANLRILDLTTGCGKTEQPDATCVQLESIPATFAKLTNLEWLDLQHNALSALPAELSALTKLTDLFLWYNKIGKVFDLSGMTDLRTAHISQDPKVGKDSQGDSYLSCLPPLAEGKRWQSRVDTFFVTEEELNLPTCTYGGGPCPTESPTDSPTPSPSSSPTKSPTALRLCGCAFDWAPVCGKNGTTYSNRCSADCDGVQVVGEGPCDDDAQWN